MKVTFLNLVSKKTLMPLVETIKNDRIAEPKD